MKYIDADRLKAEIERRMTENCELAKKVGEAFGHRAVEDNDILAFIDSLQQEQPDDIVAIAKTFLDALSKTPYNNKPITDAQIIVRQLLLFFENPKEYNPDAIFELPEVDLDALVDEAFYKYSSVDRYGHLFASFNRAELYSFIKKITRKEEEK